MLCMGAHGVAIHNTSMHLVCCVCVCVWCVWVCVDKIVCWLGFRLIHVPIMRVRFGLQLTISY